MKKVEFNKLFLNGTKRLKLVLGYINYGEVLSLNFCGGKIMMYCSHIVFAKMFGIIKIK